MNRENEARMKTKGETNVWNSIVTKSGKLKNVSSTQVGQQIVFDDSLRILPVISNWVENESANSYRNELKDYFTDEQIILEKIAETLFLLAGAIYTPEPGSNSTKQLLKSRHKKISQIQKYVTKDLSFDLTWRFVEAVVEASNYFLITKKMVIDDGNLKVGFSYSCNLSEKIMNELATEAIKAFYPTPMYNKPIDWYLDENGKIIGGYEHFQYDLIRTNSFTIDYKKFSYKIFDAVNYIQSTPWTVNADVLSIVKSDLQIPKREDYILSDFPDASFCEFDLKLENLPKNFPKTKIKKIKDFRSIYSKKLELYNAEANDFESAIGKYRAVKMAVNIAEQYEGKTIYFPHNYDFRGRIYPIPVGLTPQGSDAVKAILEYRDGEELNSEGIVWMWAYLASLYGDDKITLQKRMMRGMELIDADYKDADEPYQFLAHQLEIKKWLKDPHIKIKARVHLDACNSGSQFTSAITGDRDGCIATNVIPTFDEAGNNVRQDAYLLVSNRSLELTKRRLTELEDPEYKDILELIQSLLESSGRKICKKPVMVSNYGGTAGGRAAIMWDMFRELGVKREFITRKNASIFGGIIGESIHGVLNGGKAFEGYIQQMNNIIAKENKPITWTTHDGFFVTHVKQKKIKVQKITCTLPGSRRKTTINKAIFSREEVSSTKMKSAISPNYIHSLDAELLRCVAIRMKNDGIENTDWIHDSFGCHPNYVDKLLYFSKDEFRMLVRRNPLKILDEQLRSQVGDSKQELKELERIVRPQLKGFSVMKGHLDVVMKSEWFFS